jgi:hypothetical protein
MSQIRRNPAVSDRAASTTTTLSSKSNRAVNPCEVRGCVWRGTCPVHTLELPHWFSDIAHVMRVRPYGRAASSIGIGNCGIDLHPEVRARRLAAEVAVALRWQHRNHRPASPPETGCAGGGSAEVLRARWETIAAEAVAA